MTPDRRQHLLEQIRRVRSLEELRGMREQLRDQGEMQDSEIYRALERRFTDLSKRKAR